MGGNSDSTSSVQQFHSLSVEALRREEEERGAHSVQAVSSYGWLNQLFVTLLLRPREVYQPLESQGGGRGWHSLSEGSSVRGPSVSCVPRGSVCAFTSGMWSLARHVPTLLTVQWAWKWVWVWVWLLLCQSTSLPLLLQTFSLEVGGGNTWSRTGPS